MWSLFLAAFIVLLCLWANPRMHPTAHPIRVTLGFEPVVSQTVRG